MNLGYLLSGVSCCVLGCSDMGGPTASLALGDRIETAAAALPTADRTGDMVMTMRSPFYLRFSVFDTIIVDEQVGGPGCNNGFGFNQNKIMFMAILCPHTRPLTAREVISLSEHFVSRARHAGFSQDLNQGDETYRSSLEHSYGVAVVLEGQSLPIGGHSPEEAVSLLESSNLDVIDMAGVTLLRNGYTTSTYIRRYNSRRAHDEPSQRRYTLELAISASMPPR